jgi:hypothetical protein
VTPVGDRLPATGSDARRAAELALARRAVRSAGIPRRLAREFAPLSSQQEGIWLFEQLHPGTSAYARTFIFRLRGRLDVPALGQSLAALVERHETLRTAIRAIGGDAWQHIGSGLATALKPTDLRSAARPYEQLRERAERLADEPIDLCGDSLFEAELAILANDDHALLWRAHHLMCDGWSEAIINRDLGHLYSAITQGDTPELPPLTVQYGDYAAWQRSDEMLDRVEQDLEYWRVTLRGAMPPCQHRPGRPSVARRGSGRYVRATPPIDDLVALAQAERWSLFMPMFAAFACLVGAWYRHDDVVIGIPTAGRTVPELEAIIGHFVNVVYLRVRLAAELTFRELVTQVRETVLDALAHAEAPFHRVLGAVAADDPSASSLGRIGFQLHNVPQAPLELPDLQLEIESVPGRTPPLDLSVTFVDRAGELVGGWEFSTDEFPPPAIHQLPAVYGDLLRSVANDPDARLSRLLASLPHA